MGIISRLLDLLPSPNGARPESSPPLFDCCEAALAGLMDGLSFFDLIKCSTCFVPWPEHDPSCSQHFRRNHCIELLKYAKKSPKYRGDLRLAKVNGYVDDD
jgi:hypothetical protein